MDPELAGLTIACLSTSNWRGLWTRKQWTMSALAGRNRVLYVDPQESFTYRWRSSPQRRNAPLVQIPAGLRVVTPWSALPFGQHNRAVHRINASLLGLQLGRARGYVPPDIWWVYDPGAVPLVERYPAPLVVYDCVDRHAAYGGHRGLVNWLEARLLSRADIVFVTAQGLVAHCQGDGREVYFVSNGFDEEQFVTRLPVPSRLEAIPRPRVGFMGGLAHWVHVELLTEVARARPHWSLVFVGPKADVGGVMPAAPNTHWLGPCTRREVPAYLGGFDVGIVPFRETELTRTVNPLKAYEYLASGIPVVSTRMPELDHIPEIRQASSPDRFVAAIDDALAEGIEDDARRKRRAAVAPFSMQRGLERMLSILAEKLV